MTKNELDDRRGFDVALKKWLGGMALFLTVSLVGGIGTFIKMSSAVETLKKTTDKHEMIITNDNRSILTIEIQQTQMKEDINELKDGQKQTNKVLLQILQKVSK